MTNHFEFILFLCSPKNNFPGSQIAANLEYFGSSMDVGAVYLSNLAGLQNLSFVIMNISNELSYAKSVKVV